MSQSISSPESELEELRMRWSEIKNELLKAMDKIREITDILVNECPQVVFNWIVPGFVKTYELLYLTPASIKHYVRFKLPLGFIPSSEVILALEQATKMIKRYYNDIEELFYIESCSKLMEEKVLLIISYLLTVKQIIEGLIVNRGE